MTESLQMKIQMKMENKEKKRLQKKKNVPLIPN